MHSSRFALRLAFVFFATLIISARLAICAFAQARETKPIAAAGSSIQEDSSLVARERAMWKALQERDTLTFQRTMGSLVDVDAVGIRRTNSASVARYVTQCKVVGHSLSDFQIARDSLTAVVTYKATVDETCWGQKGPSPLHVMTVYERASTGWIPVAHSETPAAHW